MRSIKHILVVVDPTTETQHCVEKGARLARAAGAKLELFICDLSDIFSNRFTQGEALPGALARRRAALETRLHALVEPLRQSGISVMTDTCFEHPLHVGVIRKVQASGADLVIKDTHYHAGVRRALFSNSDWHLIRECPVPLLLTKPTAWKSRIRMAAALDPAHPDDKPAVLDQELLEVVEQMAMVLKGDAFAVHAFDALPLFTGMAVGSALGADPYGDVELADSLRKVHEQEFRALLAGHAAFNDHAEMIDGSPLTVLPTYVTRMNVDVLATGAVSRSLARRLWVGSTAERLLDRVTCDVLVVKPPQVV